MRLFDPTDTATTEPPQARSRRREEIPDRFKWNLSDIFPNWEEWDAAYKRIEAGIDRYAALKGTLAQGPERLLTALVLDDAFQHREMPRDADVVVVSADLWSDLPVRLLPAGPFREPLRALRRASLVIVTRKAASVERAAEVAKQLSIASGGVPLAVAHLAPGRLCPWTGGASESVEALRGQRVLAVSGIGAPDAFLAQLAAAGAQVQAATFGDHHAFSANDVQDLVARGAEVDRVICTLKDAVKLGPQWPAQHRPLWYLSQLVVIETGTASVEALLDRLISPAASHTPASAGPENAPNG